MCGPEQHFISLEISVLGYKSLDENQEDRFSTKGKADRTTGQSLRVFPSLTAETNYLMSHLQPATTRQLGLYSQAGDVFSSGIYSPHCCPARKTSTHSPAAPQVK